MILFHQITKYICVLLIVLNFSADLLASSAGSAQARGRKRPLLDGQDVIQQGSPKRSRGPANEQSSAQQDFSQKIYRLNCEKLRVSVEKIVAISEIIPGQIDLNYRIFGTDYNILHAYYFLYGANDYEHKKAFVFFARHIQHLLNQARSILRKMLTQLTSSDDTVDIDFLNQEAEKLNAKHEYLRSIEGPDTEGPEQQNYPMPQVEPAGVACEENPDLLSQRIYPQTHNDVDEQQQPSGCVYGAGCPNLYEDYSFNACDFNCPNAGSFD